MTFRCPRCQPWIAGAVCFCLAAENVPAAREHIPVPDHSRIADEPPHDENHHTAIFVRDLPRVAFTAGFSAAAIRSITWHTLPVTLSMWPPKEPEPG
jgi:hypothetical protein